jgi:hypothetical protein
MTASNDDLPPDPPQEDYPIPETPFALRRTSYRRWHIVHAATGHHTGLYFADPFHADVHARAFAAKLSAEGLAEIDAAAREQRSCGPLSQLDTAAVNELRAAAIRPLM